MKTVKLSCRVILPVLLAVLVLAVLPLLCAARFDVPCADDLSFGARAHLAYVRTGSAAAAVAAAAEEARIAYTTWQGTFSAIFLMGLQPAVFGEAAYAATPFIMLLSLIGGTFLACLSVFPELLGVGRGAAACAAALICIICTQLLPSPVQGFFWYNGAVYYTFFYGLSLAALALGIRLALRGGVWRAVLLTLLCAFLGGGNYVTALCCCIAGASGILVLILARSGRWKRLLPPMAALLISFALSIAAPGNAVRQANYAVTPGAAEAILLSFKYGAVYALRWMSLPLAGMLALLAVLFRNFTVRPRAGLCFRAPWLVSLWSFCLLSAMFCPPVYAMGNVGDARLLNMIYFTYVLLLTVNLCCWLGWAGTYLWGGTRGGAGAPLTHLAAGALVLGLCCLASMLSGRSFASVSALSSLRSGEAAAYRACAQERYDILNDSSIRDAVLPEFPCRPYVLYYDDVTRDAADWRNTAAAYYYGKDSVRLAAANLPVV